MRGWGTHGAVPASGTHAGCLRLWRPQSNPSASVTLLPLHSLMEIARRGGPGSPELSALRAGDLPPAALFSCRRCRWNDIWLPSRGHIKSPFWSGAHSYQQLWGGRDGATSHPRPSQSPIPSGGRGGQGWTGLQALERGCWVLLCGHLLQCKDPSDGEIQESSRNLPRA